MTYYLWKSTIQFWCLKFSLVFLVLCSWAHLWKKIIMKSSVRKQLLGAIEHCSSSRYHNLFDSDVFGENPLWVICTRKNQQWKASHWDYTTYSCTDIQQHNPPWECLSFNLESSQIGNILSHNTVIHSLWHWQRRKDEAKSMQMI